MVFTASQKEACVERGQEAAMLLAGTVVSLSTRVGESLHIEWTKILKSKGIAPGAGVTAQEAQLHSLQLSSWSQILILFCLCYYSSDDSEG